MKKVLVTGATGKVGSRFVSRLLAKGYDVRILVRDAAKASPLAERGAGIVIGDLDNTDALSAAVKDIDAVIIANGRGHDPSLNSQRLAQTAPDLARLCLGQVNIAA